MFCSTLQIHKVAEFSFWAAKEHTSASSQGKGPGEQETVPHTCRTSFSPVVSFPQPPTEMACWPGSRAHLPHVTVRCKWRLAHSLVRAKPSLLVASTAVSLKLGLFVLCTDLARRHESKQICVEKQRAIYQQELSTLKWKFLQCTRQQEATMFKQANIKWFRHSFSSDSAPIKHG